MVQPMGVQVDLHCEQREQQIYWSDLRAVIEQLIASMTEPGARPWRLRCATTQAGEQLPAQHDAILAIDHIASGLIVEVEV
jgi:hypothetical protein